MCSIVILSGTNYDPEVKVVLELAQHRLILMNTCDLVD